MFNNCQRGFVFIATLLKLPSLVRYYSIKTDKVGDINWVNNLTKRALS